MDYYCLLRRNNNASLTTENICNRQDKLPIVHNILHFNHSPLRILFLSLSPPHAVHQKSLNYYDNNLQVCTDWGIIPYLRRMYILNVLYSMVGTCEVVHAPSRLNYFKLLCIRFPSVFP